MVRISRTSALGCVLSAALLLGAGMVLADASDNRAGYHGAVGKNLLLNPDFELDGNGWLYTASFPNRAKHFVKPHRQPVTILPGAGVDGGACLSMPAHSMSVRSYCFPVKKDQVYTVSAYLKAPEGVDSANVSVLAINPNWKVPLWKKTGGIGKEWKQYHWTFTWDKPNEQERAYVDIGTSTGLLVDRVMIAEGENTSYEAPVMLALVGDRRAYFVRGRDKADMTIRVAPGNLYKGKADVKVVAKDAWGDVAWTKTFVADLDKITNVPVSLPTEKLGNYHVELEATQDGAVIGRGISRYAIMDPPTKAKATPGRPSPFGIQQSIYAWTPWANEQYGVLMNDTGIQFNRFFAKAPGDSEFPFPQDYLDVIVDRVKPIHDAGIEIMGCIQFFPGTMHLGRTDRMPTAEELASYKKCIREYVKVLSPYIRYWEIFNEPDLWRTSDGKKRAFSPEKYAVIQKAAYEAIKSVDPDLKVAASAMNTLRWKWMDAWFQAGGAKYMDFFSFHPYRSHPDQLNEIGVYKDIMQARSVLDTFGGQKIGMINSEQLYGCHLFYDRKKTEEVRRGYYVDNDHELEAASRQVRNLIHHTAAGATCCPFTYREEFACLGPSNGMLMYDMVPAYNATTRFLYDAGLGEPIPMGESLRAFVFPNAARGPLLAIWTPVSDAKATIELAGTYEVHDMMGNRRPEMESSNKVGFSTDVAWVRYPQGTSIGAIRKALGEATVRGVSEPLKIDLAITGEKELTVYLTSLINQPQSGTVSLADLPKAWSLKTAKKHFGTVEAGKTKAVAFAFEKMPLDGGPFLAVAKVDSTKGPLEKKQTLRPFHAAPGADKITADGDPSDWVKAGIELTPLGREHLSKDFDRTQARRGDSDLSAKVGLAWSPEQVAFIAIVTDNQHKPHRVAADGYKGDSVQLYFDQRNDATEASRNASDDISYILVDDGKGGVPWLTKGASGNNKGEANQESGLVDPEAKLAIKRVGNQTIYELVLPRRDCLPDTKLQGGGGFGFSLLINDSDGKGRKVGLTLSPTGSEPYGRPAEYRDVVLQAK